MARMPRSVRVGPYDLRIVRLSGRHAKRDYGQFCHESQEIRLRSRYASPTLAADTLLHEILHAVWWVGQIKAKEGEEHIVTVTATTLTQVIRDNPALMLWLRAAVR